MLSSSVDVHSSDGSANVTENVIAVTRPSNSMRDFAKEETLGPASIVAAVPVCREREGKRSQMCSIFCPSWVWPTSVSSGPVLWRSSPRSWERRGRTAQLVGGDSKCLRFVEDGSVRTKSGKRAE